jgi:hypothetical protein
MCDLIQVKRSDFRCQGNFQNKGIDHEALVRANEKGAE